MVGRAGLLSCLAHVAGRGLSAGANLHAIFTARAGGETTMQDRVQWVYRKSLRDNND